MHESISIGGYDTAYYASSDSGWCVDSGATSHTCKDGDNFICFQSVNNMKVRLAIDKSTNVPGKGTVIINTLVNNKQCKVRLENALFVPELKSNLFSIFKCDKKDHSEKFKNGKVVFKNKSNKVYLTANKK